MFTSERREMFAGSGWSRNVRVGDQEYTCSVRRGKSVRIPYRPRGKNIGWKWHGAVYKVGGGRVWEGMVPGSVGCRGLLIEAGVLE